MDIDGLRRLAEDLPDWTLVVVGTLVGHRDLLLPIASLPNVIVRDPEPRPCVLAMMRASDVCLVPHLDTPLTRAMSPLKIYEYLAAGAPVVATDLPPMRGISSRCLLVDNGAPLAGPVLNARALGRATPEETGAVPGRSRLGIALPHLAGSGAVVRARLGRSERSSHATSLKPMDRPPRALYSFPHTLGKAGISTTATQQIRALLDEGIDLTVICTSSMIDEPRADVITTLELLGRRIPHRALLRTQWAYDFHDAVTARFLRRGRFDLVHTWPRSCLRTAKAARRLGITSLREAPSPHTASAVREATRAAAERDLELPSGHSHALDRNVLRREEAEFDAVDLLLTPSAYARNTFLAEGIPATRLAQTQYGYDPKRFHPTPRDSSREPFNALFLGRGEPNKGLHLALRAWVDSGIADRGGRLTIAGVIWAPYGEQLAVELAHPSISVVGFVDDTPGLLAKSDVLMLPSYTEGSALVAYEAMGSGCVPLVSDAAGAPVRDGVDGFVHTVGGRGSVDPPAPRPLDRPRAPRAHAGSSTGDQVRAHVGGRRPETGRGLPLVRGAYDGCLTGEDAPGVARVHLGELVRRQT